MEKETMLPKKPLGIVIAGLSGGSGKSVISVGITAAFRRQLIYPSLIVMTVIW